MDLAKAIALGRAAGAGLWTGRTWQLPPVPSAPCLVKTSRTTRHCCTNTAAHRASPADGPACCVPSAFLPWLSVGRRRRRGPSQTHGVVPAWLPARIPCHGSTSCASRTAGGSGRTWASKRYKALRIRRPHFYTVTLKLLLPRILDFNCTIRFYCS